MREASSKSPLHLPDTDIPLLIVVSGPSGVGKDAILNRMKASGYPFAYVTTVTTRPKRAAEKDGQDYHFVAREKFQDMLDSDGLLEHAQVYGNWYGVPKQPVKESMDKGQDTIIKVDIQGAATIKKLVPDAIFIFIAPPSLEELLNRLTQRSTESQFEMDRRTKAAEAEMQQVTMFDYIVVNNNGRIEEAIARILAIITAEKCRVLQRNIKLQ